MHRAYTEQVFELVVALLALPLCWLILSGCGEQPTYTTYHGINVYEQGAEVDRADIEFITQEALRRWPTDLRGLVLRLRPKPIQYPGSNCIYSGSFAEGTMTVWAPEGECFARTTFGHELMHAIVWLETGDWDYHHKVVRPRDIDLYRATISAMCAPPEIAMLWHFGPADSSFPELTRGS